MFGKKDKDKAPKEGKKDVAKVQGKDQDKAGNGKTIYTGKFPIKLKK